MIKSLLLAITLISGVNAMDNFRSFNYFLTDFSNLQSLESENIEFINQPEGAVRSIDSSKNSYISFLIKSPMDFNEVICSVTGDENTEIETFVKINDEEFSCGAFSPKRGESKSKKTLIGTMDTDILRLSKKHNELKVRIEMRPLSDKKALIRLANFVFTDSSIQYMENKYNVIDEKIKLNLTGISQMARQISYKGDICSPTSLSCVLSYYGIKESPEKISEAVIDNSDGIYGNWLFNCAYASTKGLYSFVARLNSLKEASLYIKKGIPIIASLTFGPDELKGSPLKKTKGHLVVLKGFDKKGNVITMDPAASKDSKTEITYNRIEFEKAWLKNKYGTCYIISNDIFSFASPSFPLIELFSDMNLKNIETQILPGEKIEYDKHSNKIKALNQKTLISEKLLPYEGYAQKINFSLPENPDFIVTNKDTFIYDSNLKKTTERISIGSRVEALLNLKKGFILARSSGRSLILSTNDLSPFKPMNENTAREKIIKTARQFISDPYYWGGKSSFGVDCSGLAYLSYISAGIEIPRNASDQKFSLFKKDYMSLKVGDLVFSTSDNTKEINHVMIYSGKGNIIEATMDCKCVREISLKEKFSFNFNKNFKNGSKAGKKTIYFGSFFRK